MVPRNYSSRIERRRTDLHIRYFRTCESGPCMRRVVAVECELVRRARVTGHGARGARFTAQAACDLTHGLAQPVFIFDQG